MEKLRAYKSKLREEEDRETIEKIKNDIEIYGSFHIDNFAERVCKIEESSELKDEAENYLKNLNELRDVFEGVVQKHGFKFFRRIENGQAYS